ncbi:hypothetical protein ACVNP0_14650 [Staphylococcus aureus]
MTKNKIHIGYIVLPTAYNQGMKATSGNIDLKVEQVNGIMTGIKAPKNNEKFKFDYATILFTYNDFYIWRICRIIFTRWARQK